MKRKSTTRVLLAFMAILLVFLMMPESIFSVFAKTFANESAKENIERLDPSCTLIYTADDLNKIRNDLSGTYILMNDIDLSEYENWIPIGSADTPFMGDFFGAGYTVSGMQIKSLPEAASDGYTYVGLIGYNQGMIRDVILDGAVSTDIMENEKVYIGSLVGYNDGKILNCRDGITYQDYAITENSLYTCSYDLSTTKTDITIGKQYAIYLNGTGTVWNHNIIVEDGDLPALYIFLRNVDLRSINLHSTTEKDIYVISQGTSNVIYAKNNYRAIDLPNAKVMVLGDAPLTIYGEKGEDGKTAIFAGVAGGNGTNAIEAVSVGAFVVSMKNNAAVKIIGGNGGKGGNGAIGVSYTNDTKTGENGGNGGKGGNGGNGGIALVTNSITAISKLIVQSGDGGNGGDGGKGGNGAKGTTGEDAHDGFIGIGGSKGSDGGNGGDGGYAGNGGNSGSVSLPIYPSDISISGLVCSIIGSVGVEGKANVGGYRGDGGNGGSKSTFYSGGNSGSPGVDHTGTYSFPGTSGISPVSWKTQLIDTANGVQTTMDASDNPTACKIPIVIPDATIKVYAYTTPNAQSVWNKSEEILQPSWTDSEEENNTRITREGSAVYYGSASNPHAILIKSSFESISSCTIHPDTEYIYSYAFSNCNKLTAITIPSNIYGIGQYAFEKCSLLTRFISTQPIDDFGAKVFCDCSNLKEVLLVDHPNKIRIGTGAFQNCSSLTSIALPKGIENIEPLTFAGTKKLKQIEIPAEVIVVGDNAFDGCAQLQTVTFEKNSQLKEIGPAAFLGCNSLQAITFPDGLKSIGDNAFKENRSLTSLHIPATVKSIGQAAFYDCLSLIEITVDKANKVYAGKGNTLIEISSNQAILGCATSNLRDSGVTSVASNAFLNLNFTKPFEIPESVSLESGALVNCKGEIILLHQSMDEEFVHIEKNALLNCTSAKIYAYENLKYCDDKGTQDTADDETVYIGHNDTKLISNGRAGDHVYYVIFARERSIGGPKGEAELLLYGYGSTYDYQSKASFIQEVNSKISADFNLYYVLISNGIEEIGPATFQGFSSVLSIQIGKDVKKIGANAFDVVVDSGVSLKNISFAGDLPAIDNNAISNNIPNDQLFLINDMNAHGWTHNGKTYVCFIPGIGLSTKFPETGTYYCLETSKDLNYIDTAGYDQYGIYYEIKEEAKTAIVDHYYPIPNMADEIRIPLEIMFSGKRYKVVSIGANAFENVNTFKTIMIRTDSTGENGISSVGSEAFKGCTAQVYFVGNPIMVEKNAFDEGACVIVDQNISECEIEKGWEIENATLYYTNRLTGYQDQNGIYYTVDINTGTAIVGKKTEQNEENLNNTSGATNNEVVIPNFVTYNERLYHVVGFDRYAFFGNQTLERIFFGTFIGEGQNEDTPAIWDCTFRNVNNLVEINVLQSNPYYVSEDGVLFGSALVPEGDEVIFTRLIKYPDKKVGYEYVIRDGVTVIENYAFAGNSELKTVWLAPEKGDSFSVNVIGSHAFWNCSSLIELKGNYQLHDIGDSAFENTLLTTFKFGESLSTIGVRAFYGSKLGINLEINDNITYIGESAFGRCPEIKSFAFRDYSNSSKELKVQSVNGTYKVDFANEDVSGYAALFECHQGKNKLLQFAPSFEIPKVNGVAIYDMTVSNRIVPHIIASEAFSGAKYIEKIIMNDATYEVGSKAFAECRCLEYVKLGKEYFGSNVEDQIGGIYSYNLFIDCPVLEYIEVDEHNQNFINDSNGVLYSKDKSVLYYYPAGIQRVNYYVPESVTKIYDSAFYGNTSLKQVIVGTTEQLSIGSHAFGNCTNLTSVYYITETVPNVGEKIYDNANKDLQTRFKAEFSNKGWIQYASDVNEKAKIWCERSVDEYEIILDVPNDVIETNDYLIFIKNTSAEALSDVYVIVTVYAIDKIDKSEVLIPHKFYLQTNENGRINFSTMEIVDKPIAPYIHIYAQKEGYYTYDQDLYMDTEMLISYLTMTMDPDVFGISCEEVDINSQTSDLNLALYHEYVSYTVQNGDESTTVERIDYRDVTIRVLGFWDPTCTNPEFTLIQSDKVLPTQTHVDGNNCTFVVSAEAFFDANGFVNENPIEVRVVVQNGDKGTLECRKVLNINLLDFEIKEEDINLDIEEDISLEEGPDIFKQLFGSDGFQFKIGKDINIKTMINGSQVILKLTAETSNPEKEPEKGYRKYVQPHNKGSYFFQYYDGLLTYNVRFVRSDVDNYFYYRLYVYFGAPGVNYNESIMEKGARYGAVNLSPYEAKLYGREKVRLRSVSIFMETRKWILERFIPKDGCFNLKSFGEEGLKGFEPPCDKYVPINENNTAQVKNKHSFRAGLDGELIFEYSKGEGLHLASGSIKGYLKYTFKHNSQFVVWVIPVTLEVKISISGDIFLKLRFDNPDTSIALDELSVKLEAEIQASVGVGCSVASIGIYGNIGTVIVFDILPDPGIREWEIHGEFGAYVKIFWYKKNFSIWSGKQNIISAGDDAKAANVLQSARAKMFLASSYRYSADCDQNAQIVKINDKYYKFYFIPVNQEGYDEYNCIKLVYSILTLDGWSDYVIVEDNGKADAAYTILEDKTGVYLAYTQQTKNLTSDNINNTTVGAEGLSLKWVKISDGMENLKVDTIVDGRTSGNYKYAMQIGVVNGSPVIVWAENSDNNIFGVSSKNYYDDTTQTSHVYQTTANSIWIARYSSVGDWEVKMLVDGLSSVMDIALSSDAIYYIVDLDGDLTDNNDCMLKKLSYNGDISVDIALATSVDNHDGEIYYYGTDAISEGLCTISGEANLPKQTTMLNNGYITLSDANGIYAFLYIEAKSWQEDGETLSCSMVKGIFREGNVWGNPVILYDLAVADRYIASFDSEMIDGKLMLVMQICDNNGSTTASEFVNINLNEIHFDYTYQIDYINKKVICQVMNLGTKMQTFSVNGISRDILSGKYEIFDISFENAQSRTIKIAANDESIFEEITLNTAYIDLKPLVKQMVVGEQNSILIAIRNNGNKETDNFKLYVFSDAVIGKDSENTAILNQRLDQAIYVLELKKNQTLCADGTLYYELILDDSMIKDRNGIISLYIVADENEPEICMKDNTTSIYLSEILQTVDGTVKWDQSILPEVSIDTNKFYKYSDGTIADDVEITVISDASAILKLIINDEMMPEDFYIVEKSGTYLYRIILLANKLNTLPEGIYRIGIVIDEEDTMFVDLTINIAENIPSYVTIKWYDADGVLLHTILVKEGDAYDAPDIIVKEGYNFLRWDERSVNGNIEYTAVYEKVNRSVHKITWIIAEDLNIVQSVEDGITPIAPERTYYGKIIRGWDMNGDGKADALKAVDTDLTCVALFNDTYDIELNGSTELGLKVEVDLSSLPFFDDTQRLSKLKYQWYLNGEVIKGATSISYQPSASERGEKIWVLVWDSEWIGSSYTFEVANHSHAVFYSPYKSPTCEQSGTIAYWYCYSCNAFFSDIDCILRIDNTQNIVIPATKHKYQSIITSPTCGADGYTTYVCDNCQLTYIDSYISKQKHKMGEWTQTQAPTCSIDGIQRRDCANCDYFDIQAIIKLNHDFSETWTVDIAATCSSTGSESRHCSRCDATTEVREITKLAHRYNVGEITVEATAASMGIKTFTCENCDYCYTEKLPKAAPQIIEQDKDVWKEWTGDETITFRSNASFEDFIAVKINGELLSNEFYTLREGGIVVELKREYLNSLQNGSYQLEIVSQSGVATAEFSVDKNIIENPWVLGCGISLLSIGLLSFGVWLVFFKKKWLVLRSKV